MRAIDKDITKTELAIKSLNENLMYWEEAYNECTDAEASKHIKNILIKGNESLKKLTKHLDSILSV